MTSFSVLNPSSQAPHFVRTGQQNRPKTFHLLCLTTTGFNGPNSAPRVWRETWVEMRIRGFFAHNIVRSKSGDCVI